MKADLFAVVHVKQCTNPAETDYILVAQDGKAFLITLSTAQHPDNVLVQGQVVQGVMYDHLEILTKIKTKRFNGNVFHERSMRVAEMGVPGMLDAELAKQVESIFKARLIHAFLQYNALQEDLRFLPFQEGQTH